jgi:hypothetical protein
MKKQLLILLFCGAMLAGAQTVQAQSARVAVGAVVNSPTGVSAKVWLNDEVAVDGALSFEVSDFSNFYFHADALLHSETDNTNLLIHYGLGSRLFWSDLNNDVRAGLRVPAGVSYIIDNTDFEGFFEIAPTLDFSPDFLFGFGGAVGMRVYLN